MKLKYPVFFIIILFVLVLVRANTEHVNLLVIKNNWSIFNIPEKININNVTIPMSVTTALKLNKLIDEPLFRFNDIKLRWIADDDNWIFENKFQINDFLLKTNAVVYLILESIDSIASVYLNNRFILSASNQFLNYQLRDIGSFLVTGANTLQVKFKSPIKYANYLSLIYPYDVPPMCPPDVQNGMYSIIKIFRL
jgi:beta-mannosidase